MGPRSVSLSSRKGRASLEWDAHLGSSCSAICWYTDDGVWSNIQLIKMDLNLPVNCYKKRLFNNFEGAVHIYIYLSVGQGVGDASCFASAWSAWNVHTARLLVVYKWLEKVTDGSQFLFSAKDGRRGWCVESLFCLGEAADCWTQND